ncbi:MAG: DUF4358 domain-containing protein [Clostridia bacterium]
MKHYSVMLFCFTVLLCLLTVSCGEDANKPNNTINMDEISAVITAEMKADLIAEGGYKETEFENGALPGYRVNKLNDKDFSLPIKYERDDFSDAVIISHEMNVNSDMILVMKARDDAAVTALEGYAKALHNEQIRVWERYLPDQFQKVRYNIIKTSGRYVIYVTYDNPKKLLDAISNTIK